MTYSKTDLPEKVQMYLEEIYNDEDLLDAFFNCDIEILKKIGFWTWTWMKSFRILWAQVTAVMRV